MRAAVKGGAGPPAADRIAKTEFLHGLRLAQGIADRKSTMPMLANVLYCRVGDSELRRARIQRRWSRQPQQQDLAAIGGGNRGPRVLAWIDVVELRGLEEAVEVEVTCVALRDFDPW